jgi:hypothetical protein
MRRWIRLVVTVGAAEQKCSELVLMGMARARFCELLSDRTHPNSDLLLMGLLSVMDAILEVTMHSLLQQLPVEHETKAVLPWPEKQPSAALSADAGAGIGGMGAVRGTGERLETERRRRRLDVVAGSAMGAGSDEWGV